MWVPSAIWNRNARVAENGESSEGEDMLAQREELRTGYPGLVDVREPVEPVLGSRTLY